MFKKLSLLLVLLMLSNSSLALEILTHDSHQHADAQIAQHEMHEMHEMMDENSAVQMFDHGSDECICDDICCVSSIDFGRSINADQLPPVARGSIANPNFYRSISIDLLLPPPTR